MHTCRAVRVRMHTRMRTRAHVHGVRMWSTAASSSVRHVASCVEKLEKVKALAIHCSASSSLRSLKAPTCKGR